MNYQPGLYKVLPVHFSGRFARVYAAAAPKANIAGQETNIVLDEPWIRYYLAINIHNPNTWRWMGPGYILTGDKSVMRWILRIRPIPKKPKNIVVKWPLIFIGSGEEPNIVKIIKFTRGPNGLFGKVECLPPKVPNPKLINPQTHPHLFHRIWCWNAGSRRFNDTPIGKIYMPLFDPSNFPKFKYRGKLEQGLWINADSITPYAYGVTP